MFKSLRFAIARACGAARAEMEPNHLGVLDRHRWRDEIRAAADSLSRSHGYKSASLFCQDAATAGSQPQDPEFFLLAAVYEWVAGDYSSAARLANLALALGGDISHCRDMACSAHASACDWMACVITAERLVADVPEQPAGYRWLALAHEALGHRDDMNHWAAEALARDPQDEMMRARLATHHQAPHDFPVNMRHVA